MAGRYDWYSIPKTIIYHNNCPDGFTAAWVAHSKFGDHDVQFHPANFGEPPPDVAGHDVLIADFSYARDVLQLLHGRANSLQVLDHHFSAEQDLRGLPFCVFDMERSGAGLTWDTLFPDTPRPWIVDYIEDHDLWRFKLPDSSAVRGYLGSVPRTFEAYDALVQVPLTEVIEHGRTVERYVANHVRELVDMFARQVEFEGMRVWAINLGGRLVSETLHALNERSAVSVAWCQKQDGKYLYSLRSNGDVDVSELARHYGGGGHRTAAGFRTDRCLWL